jgi:hypothetical protein
LPTTFISTCTGRCTLFEEEIEKLICDGEMRLLLELLERCQAKKKLE